ncbi:MAG: hypothetical protein M3Z22_08740 [Verrucomicrobiota bacterium]|nr:hypothetical protein [Verrucomicrobiota bacterium]
MGDVRSATHHDWNFAAFAVVLLQTILLYMLAGLALPEFTGEQAIDLRENYYAHRGWFFGLTVAAGLVSVAKDLVVNGALPDRANLSFHCIFMLLCAIAAVTRREWYHKCAVLLVAVLFTLYIAMLFAHLG